MKTFVAFTEQDDGLGDLTSADLSPDTRARLAMRLAAGMQVWRGHNDGAQPHDPGDFGSGLYHSSSRARARSYGTLAPVTIRLQHPLILSAAEAYDRLTHVHDTVTAHHSQRPLNAQRLTAALKARGYDGLAVINTRSGSGAGEIEFVVFP